MTKFIMAFSDQKTDQLIWSTLLTIHAKEFDSSSLKIFLARSLNISSKQSSEIKMNNDDTIIS